MAASTINKSDEQDRGHEDAMQTTTASISDMATATETPKQEQKRLAGKCSDPLIAANTASSLRNGGTIQPAAAAVRQFHPESRSRRDGGSELVTGVTIKLTLQASTTNRSQFMQETNPLSSGVMVCGCFEVEVHRIW